MSVLSVIPNISSKREKQSCAFLIAAEQKARTTYDNLLRLIDNPDVREPLKFLRAREVVHFQRFGDGKQTT